MADEERRKTCDWCRFFVTDKFLERVGKLDWQRSRGEAAGVCGIRSQGAVEAGDTCDRWESV